MSSTNEVGPVPDAPPGIAVSTPLILVALLVSAVVPTLCMPPLSLLVLHPVAFVPGMLVLARFTGKKAFFLGWLWGILIDYVIFYSIVPTLARFAGIPLPLGALVMLLHGAVYGLYVAFFAWGAGLIRRMSGPWWPVALAAWFTACEFLNRQLFYYYQGSAWYRQSWIFLVVALAGQSVMTFQVMLWNGTVAALVERFLARRQRLGTALLDRTLVRSSVLALVLVALSVGWSVARLRAVDAALAGAPTVKFAIIQTNETVERHLEMEAKDIVLDHVSLTREALAEGPVDVVVWPEGAITGTPTSEVNAPLRTLAQETKTEIWTGAQRTNRSADGSKTQTNSAYRILGNGEVDARYDKNILLPFGEYMPGLELFPVLGKIPGVGRYKPGDGQVAFEAKNARFSFLICYEAVRSAYVRKAIAMGIDLLVNISYDGWFGRSNGPSLHLMMSSVQAAQYGVPLVRAATTGISAFVDPAGRLLETSGLYTREFLVRALPIVRVPSPYAALGDYFPWGCLIISAFLLGRARTPRRTR